MLYDMCHVMLCYITKYVILRHLNCISFQCVMLRYNISHAMLYNMLYNICHVMLYNMCHTMLYNICHVMLYDMCNVVI